MMPATVVRLPLVRRKLPPPGRVELWISDLASFPSTEDLAQPNHRDQGRALKFRQRFLLRLLLGSYLGCPGKDIRFEYGPAGKPVLIPALAASGLEFNLSHSGTWLALAVTRGSAVGMDIECRRELPRASALAKRFLSSPEAHLIAELAEPERSARFLALWSRREALVKAMGASVVASAGRIELDPGAGRPLALPSDWPAPSVWTLLEPALPSALIGALAIPLPGQVSETMVLDGGSVSLQPGCHDRLA